MSWLNDIYENNDFWVEGAEENYPCLISFEYRRLREFCKDSNAYALRFCLNENFESLLKFETLISYAWAVSNMEVAFVEKTVAMITKESRPSFGTWIELAGILIRDLKKAGAELPDSIPLQEIVDLYKDNEIVNWRNENIGHGIMGFEEDEDFRNDTESYLKVYHSILSRIDIKLKEQRLFILDDRNLIELTGADNAKNFLNDGKVMLKIGISGDEEEFVLDPFLNLSVSKKSRLGVYCFDQQKLPTMSVFRAYADGVTNSWRQGYFETLYRCNDAISLYRRASNRHKSLKEYRKLDTQISKAEYVQPTHLMNWIKESIEKHEKGVFMLKMQRGTGKSVFAEKLNCLFEKPIAGLEDVDIRTYHLNRVQSAGEKDFISWIQHQWSKGFKNSCLNEYVGLCTIDGMLSEYDLPAEAFAAFLSDVLISREEAGAQNKILMVFDGLDEVVNKRIREFFTIESYLTEGVYILFTSRDPEKEDMPEDVSKFIRDLPITEEYCFDLRSEASIRFLKEYISRFKIKSKDIKEKMMEAASYRVLNLVLLCTLYKKGMDIDELIGAKSFVKMYISFIEEHYTEREYHSLEELLIILSLLGDKEIMTLSKIGQLSSENDITIGLVGLMADLSPLLNISRDKEGNRYRIVNVNVSNELMEQIPERENMIRNLVDMAMAVIREDEIPEKNSGYEALCEHVIELAMLLPGKTEVLGNDRKKDIEGFLERVVDWDVGDPYEREVKIHYLRQIYAFYTETYGETDEMTMFVKQLLSDTLYTNGDYKESLEISRELFEKVRNNTRIPDYVILRLANGIIASYMEQWMIEEALDFDYKEMNRDITENADNAGLLWVYKGARAMLYALSGLMEEALITCEQIEERFNNVFDIEPENIIAIKKYVISVYILSNDYEKALKETRKSYEYAQKKLGDFNYFTVTLLDTLGYLLGKTGMVAESIQNGRLVLREMNKMFGAGHPNTLYSKLNLSASLFMEGCYEEAIAMMEDVCENSAKIYGDEHYMTRGIQKACTYMKKRARLEQDMEEKKNIYVSRMKMDGEDDSETLLAQKEYFYSLYMCIKDEGTFEKKYREFPGLIEEIRKLLKIDRVDDFNRTLAVGEDLYMRNTRLQGDKYTGAAAMMSILAWLYNTLERRDEAVNTQEKVVMVQERMFGKEDKKTISSKKALYVYYKKAGMIEKAESLKKELGK